jgi:rhodanese-related sulfurtransferase
MEPDHYRRELPVKTARLHPVPLILALAGACLLPVEGRAETVTAISNALEEYFDFVDYGGGQLSPAQLGPDDYQRFLLLDVRTPGEFAEGHIPGAVNIEWRQVFAQRQDLPRERPILAYCSTGALSSQAALSLRLVGFENVKILHGGFEGWKAHANAIPEGSGGRAD